MHLIMLLRGYLHLTRCTLLCCLSMSSVINSVFQHAPTILLQNLSCVPIYQRSILPELPVCLDLWRRACHQRCHRILLQSSVISDHRKQWGWKPSNVLNNATTTITLLSHCTLLIASSSSQFALAFDRAKQDEHSFLNEKIPCSRFRSSFDDKMLSLCPSDFSYPSNICHPNC